MIHPDDAQAIERMLGVMAEIPAKVIDEYEIRILMYHRSGFTGAIGVVPLIDMLRSLGYGPVMEQSAKMTVDWTQFPQDGSCRVETLMFGEWMPGAFVGFESAGMLAIRLDADPMVREIRADLVRLSTKLPPSEDEIPPAAKLYYERQPVVHAASPAMQSDMDTDEEYDSYGDLNQGDSVYVGVGDELKAGTFVSVKVRGGDESQTILNVEIEGNVKEVNAEDVTKQ